MPDINLLHDSSGDSEEEQRKKNVNPSELKMSKAEKDEENVSDKPKLKKPPGFFKSITSVLQGEGKRKEKKRDRAPQPSKDPVPPISSKDEWKKAEEKPITPKQDFQEAPKDKPIDPISPTGDPHSGPAHKRKPAKDPTKQLQNAATKAKAEAILEMKTKKEKPKGAEKGTRSVFSKLFSRKKKNAKPEMDTGSGDTFLDVNLMPGTITDVDIKKKYYALAVYGAVSVLIVVVVYGGLLWYESRINQQAKDVDAEIAAVEGEIESHRDVQLEAIEFKEATDNVKQLLDSHIYWTEFFEKLEEYTATDVYYVSFSASPRGDVSLTARGPDFSAPARQLLIFENQAKDFVQDVTINSASASADEASGTFEVNFSIQMTLVDGVFNRLAKEAKNGGTR